MGKTYKLCRNGIDIEEDSKCLKYAGDFLFILIFFFVNIIVKPKTFVDQSNFTSPRLRFMQSPDVINYTVCLI